MLSQTAEPAVAGSEPEPYWSQNAAPRGLGLPIVRLGRKLSDRGSVFAGLLLLALIAAAVLWGEPAPVVQAAAPVAPPADPWVEIVRPMPFFALDGSEMGREPARYEARRHRTGGGRIDTLTFGAAEDDAKPYMRVSLYRAGGEEIEPAPFYVALARLAAQARLAVARSAAPDALPTRFGDYQAADLSLQSGAGDRPCLGFRTAAQGLDFFVTGLACGTAGRPLDRAILACVIDRLDLLAAGDDRPLASYFAAAEPSRGKGCQTSRLVAAASRDNWLDAAGKVPALRASAPQERTKARRQGKT